MARARMPSPSNFSVLESLRGSECRPDGVADVPGDDRGGEARHGALAGGLAIAAAESGV